MRFCRLIILPFFAGIVTILCHGKHLSSESFVRAKLFSDEHRSRLVVSHEAAVPHSQNEAPVITGQSPRRLTVEEDNSITISLSHLEVTDPDNTYPQDFTLSVGEGENYDVTGSTIMPEKDFVGVLTIPVTVHDGTSSSNTFDFKIHVTQVNDAPIITAQNPNPVVTAEEQPVTISLSNLVVSDPDNAYPAGFTLNVSDGADYSVSGNTVTPDPDYTGTLSVNVSVNDGQLSSNTFGLIINVSNANDAPAITAQNPNPIVTNEDQPVGISFSNLVVTDSDDNYPSGFTINVLPGANYIANGSTIIPETNFSGSLSVPVTVNDGAATSAQFNLAISVNPVNDPPVITGQQAISTNEGQPVSIDFNKLTVTDPDNSYPNGFVMTLTPGNNYTFSGNSVTPSPGFSGEIQVGVVVNDGVSNSNVYPVRISVQAVNDPPVITGHKPLSVMEDNSLTINLSDLTVSDPDNSYPSGFSLSLQQGTNYQLSGSSVIPSQDFNGTLEVPVTVSDGQNVSAPFNVAITVLAVNDAPLITGQNPLSTSEDQPIAIQLHDLIVNDPDSQYPGSFTLSVSPGQNYSVSGSTVTPETDFKGTLTIPVQVNDGEFLSNVFEITVNVSDVNDAPVITGQTPIGIAEDTQVTLELAHLTVFDSDNSYPTGFSLTVAPGENYSVSGTTITPAADFTGTLNITVTVNDGVNDSPPFVFQVQVGDTNDPPTIVSQTTLVFDEEQSINIELGHLTVVDPDNSYPNGFTILVSPGDHYTVNGSSITPELNFFGTLSVPVRVNDGINNSATFMLSVDVSPVNDAPSFETIPGVSLSENESPSPITIRNISKGPNEPDQTLTIVAASGNLDIIPSVQVSYDGVSSTALLSYSVVPNRSGVVTITVTATDNGQATAPHQNTFVSTFQVAVDEINAAPTLDAIGVQTITEDSPMISIPLSGITAGEGENQSIAVTVSSDRPELFEIIQASYVSPGTTGSIDIKPAPDANGSAQVTVTVTDNGSSISPSVNTVSRVFNLSIQPVNDAPEFVSAPVTVAAMQESYEYNIEISDAESSSLTIAATQKPAWANFTTLGNNRAILNGRPGQGASSAEQVRIAVYDGEHSVEQTFNLTVNTRPEVKGISVSVEEDSEFVFQASTFAEGYTDANGHALQKILITATPVAGSLSVSGVEIKPNDTITHASIASLVYKPSTDFYGADSFSWKANDGYHFSSGSATTSIVVGAVNDAPMITMESDSLRYDVNGEASALTSSIVIADPDNDSLRSAQITFRKLNYEPEYDMLTYNRPGRIKGTFDFQTGTFTLTGHAPLSEYENAIKSIEYTYLNTIDPLLKLKAVSVTVNDGTTDSEPVERFIELQHSFVELEIPTGFTPNGDNANDQWIISRPGGIEQLNEAIIRVFNKKGALIHEAFGFGQPWDGTSNGQTVPAGNYYYTIDLKLRNKKIYKGVITILR